MRRVVIFALIIALVLPLEAGAILFSDFHRAISVTSGAGTHQRGSYVVSETGSITYRTEGDLLLEAGKSTYSGKTTESTHTASAFFGTSGGSSVSAGASKSKDSWSGTTWTNSGAYAEQGTVRFDVAGDMRAEGFNALGRHIVADVGGDLDLISRQNTSSSSGSSFGVNAGFGFGAPDPEKPNAPVSKNVSGGINQGKSHGDRAWADSTSSLVGTESVDISVGGNLGLSGSVIANIKDDGADGGNLRISAASLSHNDLQNHDEYENRGYGFSTSTGHSLPENAPPSGTTSVSLTHQGHETEGVTRSTIGQGAITVAGVNTDPAGLNRDLSKIDEITSDKITGSLDATMNIDNRVFTGAGWASIASDIANFGGNLVAAAEGAGKATVYIGKVIGDAAMTVADAISGTGNVGKNGVIDTIDKKISQLQFENAARHLENQDCVDYLNGKRDFTPEQLQNIGDTLSAVAAQYGLDAGDLRIAADLGNGTLGVYMPGVNGKGSYIVLNTVDPNGDFVDGPTGTKTVHHELVHPGTEDEIYADYMGDSGLAAHNLARFLYGESWYTPAGSAGTWLAQYGNDPYIAESNKMLDDALESGQARRNIFGAMHLSADDAEYYLTSEDYRFYRLTESGGFASGALLVLSFGTLDIDFRDSAREAIGNYELPEDLERSYTGTKVAAAVETALLLRSVWGLWRAKDAGTEEVKKDDYSYMSREDQKSIRNYTRRIEEHQQKIENFKNNPTVRPGMENLSPEAIQAQQASRLRHFDKEIQTFKNNIDKILRKYSGE